jgi:glutamyl-tRNA synthetase
VKATKRAEGKQPAIRFHARAGSVTFSDLIHGTQTADVERDIGDVVIRRADRVWSYQLAVVVDDLAMGIREVVRGDELLPSAATQVALCRALGAEPPSYVHVPLLLDTDGERMAQRKGSLTLSSLRDAGVPAARVTGLLPRRSDSSSARFP